MSDTPEYTLQISGDPSLERALRDLTRGFGDGFQIEAVEEIDYPARLGFKLSKAVAIVAVISGVLTSTANTRHCYQRRRKTKRFNICTGCSTGFSQV